MAIIEISLSKQQLSEIRDRKNPPCVHRYYELLPTKRLASYYLHKTDIFKNTVMNKSTALLPYAIFVNILGRIKQAKNNNN